MSPEIDREFPLHYCAFFGLPEFEEILKKSDAKTINKTDPYGNFIFSFSQIFLGNTPLHIAAMLRDQSNNITYDSVSFRNMHAFARK